MSVDYCAKIARGFFFGENDVPTFDEFCARNGYTENEKEKLLDRWNDDDYITRSYYGGERMFFGYTISEVNLDSDFSATPVGCLDIDACAEYSVEKEFFNAFKEYPPVFTTYLLNYAW